MPNPTSSADPKLKTKQKHNILHSLTNLGEAIVTLELIKQGHKVLKTNLRLGYLEIDIISYKKPYFYIWEVRLRTNLQPQKSPGLFVSNYKIYKFKKAAWKLIKQFNLPPGYVKLKIMLITRKKAQTQIIYKLEAIDII